VARTIFNEKDRQSIHERLARLDPAARPRFGRMTPGAMICHMKDAVEVAIGVAPSKIIPSRLSNPVLRRIAIYYMPWPKGKVQTAPEMLKTKPEEWAADLARLRALLDVAAERGPDGDWAVHPAFGNISGKDYGVLLYRHFDHHLVQFGA
jgi:hypothetical protein